MESEPPAWRARAVAGCRATAKWKAESSLQLGSLLAYPYLAMTNRLLCAPYLRGSGPLLALPSASPGAASSLAGSIHLTIEGFRAIVAQEGYLGLFRGLPAYVAHGALRDGIVYVLLRFFYRSARNVELMLWGRSIEIYRRSREIFSQCRKAVLRLFGRGCGVSTCDCPNCVGDCGAGCQAGLPAPAAAKPLPVAPAAKPLSVVPASATAAAGGGGAARAAAGCAIVLRSSVHPVADLTHATLRLAAEAAAYPLLSLATRVLVFEAGPDGAAPTWAQMLDLSLRFDGWRGGLFRGLRVHLMQRAAEDLADHAVAVYCCRRGISEPRAQALALSVNTTLAMLTSLAASVAVVQRAQSAMPGLCRENVSANELFRNRPWNLWFLNFALSAFGSIVNAALVFANPATAEGPAGFEALVDPSEAEDSGDEAELAPAGAALAA